MSEVSKSLIVTFDALNLVKGIKSIGGPDKQVYYIESNIFAPDRRITPLILQPYLLVEDPHEIIPNGDKVSELSSAKWYFDEIKSENRITAKEESASIDTPFALGANNSLHIRKNVEKAIQLFFEAEYLDIRKNKNIHITLTYLLTTTQSSEVKPAPKLKLSKPQSWKYCPLDKITEATIEAEVFADNKGYKSAVEWCKVEGDKVTPLSNEPFVLGGQNTDKLKVNPSLMNDSLILARNLSEKAYNKAYGINPDWDSKMSEVFENRNYLRNSELDRNFVGGWIRYEIVGVENLLNKDLIFNYDSEPGFNVDAILTDWDWTGAISVKKNTPFKMSSVKKYLAFTTSAKDKSLSSVKMELGKSTTPYTPAPEDLNFRNYVLNSDYSKIRSNIDFPTGWSVTYNATAELINEGSSKSIKFTAKIGGNAGSNRLYIPCDRDWKNLGIYPVFVFDCMAENEDSTLQISIDGGGTFDTKIEKGFFKTYVVDTKIKATTKMAGVAFHPLKANTTFLIKNVRMASIYPSPICYESPYDIAPDGIIPGEYQTDIKFTKYFPEINAEILFLTGDSIRPENKVVKAQAIFTTNKEPINNPSEFFDIEWYLDPVEAGGAVKKIGTGEFMEIPVSDLQLKGGRLVPIRLKYNFK